eukprot:2244464-Prymnesium_polylepis.1
MAIAWRPHDDHMATIWQSHGNRMAITWQSHGDHMATTWRSHGNHMAITWQSHNNRMVLERLQRRLVRRRREAVGRRVNGRHQRRRECAAWLSVCLVLVPSRLPQERADGRARPRRAVEVVQTAQRRLAFHRPQPLLVRVHEEVALAVRAIDR